MILGTLLKKIGSHLRMCRKQRFPDDTQKSFAFRIGINRNTLSAMENGLGNVGLPHYIKAAELLGCENQFNSLFEPPPATISLFDKAEMEK